MALPALLRVSGAMLLALAATGAGGCLKKPVVAPPAATPPPPPLTVPAPPELHLVAVVLEAPPPEPPPVTEMTSTTPPPRTSSTGKPPAPPPTPPPPPTEPPSAVVQTSRNVDELEKSARADIARAQEILKSVVFATLTPAAKGNYNDAQRFITRALSNIKDKKFIDAAQDADKAKTFAEALMKR
jgi:hypothetical protein